MIEACNGRILRKLSSRLVQMFRFHLYIKKSGYGNPHFSRIDDGRKTFNNFGVNERVYSSLYRYA